MSNLDYTEELITGAFDDPYYDTFTDKFGGNDPMSPWFHIGGEFLEEHLDDDSHGMLDDEMTDEQGILDDEITGDSNGMLDSDVESSDDGMLDSDIE